MYMQNYEKLKLSEQRPAQVWAIINGKFTINGWIKLSEIQALNLGESYRIQIRVA